MRANKRYIVLWLSFLLLVACGSEGPTDQAPASQPSPGSAQNATATDSPTEEAPPEPSSTVALPELTEEQEEDAGMVTVKEVQTLAVAEELAEGPPATEAPATEIPATVTALPQINGQYEGTFYRGLATAPITMIDYSDFL